MRTTWIPLIATAVLLGGCVVAPPDAGYPRGYRDGPPPAARGMGDRDRDGIPNRYDRDNGNRHDRDGDGVPNRDDRRPDNPRRN